MTRDHTQLEVVLRRGYTCVTGLAGAVAVWATMTVVTEGLWPVEVLSWVLFPFTWFLITGSALAAVLAGSFFGNAAAVFIAPVIAGGLFAAAGNLQFRLVAWVVQVVRHRIARDRASP